MGGGGEDYNAAKGLISREITTFPCKITCAKMASKKRGYLNPWGQRVVNISGLLPLSLNLLLCHGPAGAEAHHDAGHGPNSDRGDVSHQHGHFLINNYILNGITQKKGFN